ncbi:MAG: hypothetical protein J5706_07095 [Elusimicrobiales bacterium]|nr:hypothetical protein [Elusimicrobiales bacterium]
MTKFVKAIKDFSGGLSEVANDNIPDNRLVTAKNVVPGDGYGIGRATGTSVAFEQIEDAGPVVFLAELVEEDDGVETTHIIAGVEKDADTWNLYDWDGEDWTLVTDSNENADISPILSWFVYTNTLFWLDGTSFKQYDGDEIALVTKDQDTEQNTWSYLQSAVAVEQHNGRWFFAMPDNQIVWSEVGYYDKIVSTNMIPVLPGVNDHITALHEFNDGLLIFLSRSVYNLAGSDFNTLSDLSMVKLSVESGTKWPKSIKTISNAVLYLGDNGVYKLSIPYFTSSVASKNISDKQASKRLTEAALDVYAEVYNGIYYITLRTSAEIKEYRYYLDAGSWWGEYTQQPRCYAPKLGGDDRLFLGCANGYILYYDPACSHYISTDSGQVTTIPVEVLTKGYDVVGGTVIDSKVKRVFIVFKQYDAERSGLTVQVKTDYTEGAWEANIDSMRGVVTAVLRDVTGDESLVWSEGIWSQAYWGWIDTVTKQFQLNKKCKRVQFKFMDDSSDEPLLVYGIAMLYKKKKAKGSRMGIEERTVTYTN